MRTPPDLNDAEPSHNRISRCAVPEKPGSACPPGVFGAARATPP